MSARHFLGGPPMGDTMSIRLGSVTEGKHYEVEFHADVGNDGLTYVLVGWQPAPGSDPQSYPMRIEADQKALHALNCPAASMYYLIEVRVDVPEPGKGTLWVRGLNKGDKQVAVAADETYWVEIRRG
jgi:hypothetical protein